MLWGEYAVLAGAPAMVMAVNRYAQVALQTNTQAWHFSGEGFLTPSLHKYDPSFSHAPITQIAETILRQWGYTQYPHKFNLNINSRGFYQAGHKLGIGSSAAVTVATYQALAKLLDRNTNLAEISDIHRIWQGGRGSGLDVATSWLGGIVRFQGNHTSAYQLPSQMRWQVVWSGASASTALHLQRFSQWRAKADTRVLDHLASISQVLCDNPLELSTLEEYVAVLVDLDNQAKLNIFTHEHQRLATIAAHHGLVYKPCGAGGGDIGIAFSEDRSALEAFSRAATAEHFFPLEMEIAPNGVTFSE